jgi:hypothetical protein
MISIPMIILKIDHNKSHNFKVTAPFFAGMEAKFRVTDTLGNALPLNYNLSPLLTI